MSRTFSREGYGPSSEHNTLTYARQARTAGGAYAMLDKAHRITNAELFEHITRYQRDRNDSAARDAAINANLRLVRNIARHYSRPGVSVNDLFQEGFFGLLRALEDFDASLGNQFSTYATYWIKQKIKLALTNQGTMIRIPVCQYELWRKICTFAERFRRTLDREPTEDEIAAGMDVPIKKIRRCLEANRTSFTLSATMPTDGRGNRDEFTVEAADPHLPPDDAMIERETLARCFEILASLEIDSRERDVITRRFGLSGNKPQTLKEVGLALGLTRERIRQIEYEGLRRIRRLLNDEKG